MAIKENILRIRERIRASCVKSGRLPESVTLVAVTKNRGVEQIKEAIAYGIVDIGENRIQEAIDKYSSSQLATGDLQLRWHMVGHLQTNKVKDAVKIFDLIHSVDSLRLAQEIDKQAARINKVQDILIEVKTSPEETKSGVKPEEAEVFLKDISGLNNIKVRGLMTIAPLADNPENSRPYFRALRELRDKINQLRATSYELRTISMGMTDDFEVAIEEGADMVRLGRAIFD